MAIGIKPTKKLLSLPEVLSEIDLFNKKHGTHASIVNPQTVDHLLIIPLTLERVQCFAFWRLLHREKIGSIPTNILVAYESPNTPFGEFVDAVDPKSKRRVRFVVPQKYRSKASTANCALALKELRSNDFKEDESGVTIEAVDESRVTLSSNFPPKSGGTYLAREDTLVPYYPDLIPFYAELNPFFSGTSLQLTEEEGRCPWRESRAGIATIARTVTVDGVYRQILFMDQSILSEIFSVVMEIPTEEVRKLEKLYPTESI